MFQRINHPIYPFIFCFLTALAYYLSNEINLLFFLGIQLIIFLISYCNIYFIKIVIV